MNSGTSTRLPVSNQELEKDVRTEGNALPFLKLMKHKIHKLIQFHPVPRHKALYDIHAAAPADGPTSMEEETPARPTTSLLLLESKDNCLKHCWPHMLKQNITVNP